MQRKYQMLLLKLYESQDKNCLIHKMSFRAHYLGSIELLDEFERAGIVKVVEYKKEAYYVLNIYDLESLRAYVEEINTFFIVSEAIFSHLQEFYKKNENTEVDAVSIIKATNRCLQDLQLFVHYFELFENKPKELFSLDNFSLRVSSKILEYKSYEHLLSKLETHAQSLLQNLEKKPQGFMFAGDILANSFKSQKVFVTHKENCSLQYELIDFLTKLGLKPLALKALTKDETAFVEYVQEHKEVEYALVLYAKEACSNLVFEHGYLVGTLKHKNICVLYEEGAKVPYNVSEAISISEDGAWKLSLVQTLEEAKFRLKSAL